MSHGKVGTKPVNAYPHIPAETLGVILEYDLQPDECAVQVNPRPTMSYLSAASRENSGLAQTSQVLHTTGVEPTYNVVDLIDADDDDVEDLTSEVVHKVGSIPANDNNQPKDKRDQAEELKKKYGRGMIIIGDQSPMSLLRRVKYIQHV